MRSNFKNSIIVFTFAVILTGVFSARGEILVDDFEAAGALSRWTFFNGAEYPGATGSLSLDQGRPGSGMCARLTFDMTGGGNYVSASRTLAVMVKNVSNVSFLARAPLSVSLVCRITDSTNQTLQFPLLRPFFTYDSSTWFIVSVNLDDEPSAFWGGAGDGSVHGGVKAISILAEPQKDGALGYFTPRGAVLFDEVIFHDANTLLIDAAAAAVSLGQIGPLSGKLGANIHFTRDDRALDSLSAAGFSWVRMDLTWASVENVKGVYNFVAFDTLVAALTRRNMKAHLILDYSNTLYPGVSAWNVGPVDPAAVAGFAAFCKASALHFAGKVLSFEIWNEPNLGGFWQPAADTAAYATLCKAAISAVHEGNQYAKVSTGGLSGMDQEFMRGTLSLGGGAGANAFGVHPYRKGAPESMLEELALMKLLVSKYAPVATPPIWQTEWGYSSAWYGSGSADSSRQIQALLVVREFISSWIAGFPFMIYYDARDDGTDPLDAEHNFGLLTNDYRNKPAMIAVKTLVGKMNNWQLAGYLPAKSSTLIALKCTNASAIMLVLWASKGSGWTGYDTPKEIVSVPVEFMQQPESIVDIYGNQVAIPVPINGRYPLIIQNSAVYVTFAPTIVRAASLGPLKLRSALGASKKLSIKTRRSAASSGMQRYSVNGGLIPPAVGGVAAGIVIEKKREARSNSSNLSHNP